MYIVRKSFFTCVFATHAFRVRATNFHTLEKSWTLPNCCAIAKYSRVSSKSRYDTRNTFFYKTWMFFVHSTLRRIILPLRSLNIDSTPPFNQASPPQLSNPCSYPIFCICRGDNLIKLRFSPHALGMCDDFVVVSRANVVNTARRFAI